MFVWHYPKASSRWKWGRRNNPVPKGQMNSLGRKERGRKCSVLPWSAGVHTAHSSSVPLASDCSCERKVERVEGATSPSMGRQALTVEARALSMLRSAQPTIPRQCLPAAFAVCHFGFSSLWQTVSIFMSLGKTVPQQEKDCALNICSLVSHLKKTQCFKSNQNRISLILELPSRAEVAKCWRRIKFTNILRWKMVFPGWKLCRDWVAGKLRVNGGDWPSFCLFSWTSRDNSTRLKPGLKKVLKPEFSPLPFPP